jgi:hypothetical protein
MAGTCFGQCLKKMVSHTALTRVLLFFFLFYMCSTETALSFYVTVCKVNEVYRSTESVWCLFCHIWCGLVYHKISYLSNQVSDLYYIKKLLKVVLNTITHPLHQGLTPFIK